MEEGHINDTYKITCPTASFILQKKNAAVFKNMAALFFNLEAFIQSTSDMRYSTVYIRSRQNQLYYTDENSDRWILMNFLAGRQANTADINDLESLGNAVGTFLEAGVKLKANFFKETIPSFHNIKFRFSQYDDALLCSNKKHLNEAKPLIDVIEKERIILLDYFDFLKNNCPLRICHNDTKSDNIIILDDQAILVDLDTIMPGYLAFDFGDTLRSLVGKGKEDDLAPRSKEESLLIKYHFRKGFLKTSKSFVTQPEFESLDYAPQYMLYLMGVRFLTDFLNNNLYYKTSYPLQNLNRAQGQINLASFLKTLY